MKTEGISKIKKELQQTHPEKLIEYCLRLSKFKLENKELMNYLLFHSQNENKYITEVIKDIDQQFTHLNRSRIFLAKKTVRKALRIVNKHSRFSPLKTTELELHIHFCKKLKSSGLVLRYGTVLGNMYMREIQKINKIMSVLHEDLQLDYEDEIARIS